MTIRRIPILLALSWLGSPLLAASITSRQTGPWSDPLTWQRNGNPSDNVVPASTDSVTVQNGHIVTLDHPDAQSGPMTVAGMLIFSRSTSTCLTLSNGSLDVVFMGVLDMGTEASPIPAGVTARLLLARGGGSTRYGLNLAARATFTSRGADKDLVTTAFGNTLTGATGLFVITSYAKGWAPGDVITIGATRRTTPWENQTEERVILSTATIAPSVMQVNWAGGSCTQSGGVSVSGALCFDHMEIDGTRVANLTRNVVVRSSGTDLSSDTAEVYSMNLASFTASQTEFAFLGAGGASGLLFENMTGSISSSTVHHGHRGIATSGSGGATVTGSVLYRNLTNLRLLGTGEATISSNDVIGGLTTISGGVEGNGAGLVSGNFIYSNVKNGAINAGSVVEDNRVYCNGEAGIGESVFSRHHFARNKIFNNTSHGFSLTVGSSHVVEGNDVWGNGGQGLRNYGSPGGIYAGNRTHDNLGEGTSFEGGPGAHVVLTHVSYNNTGPGLHTEGGATLLIQDSLFGYDAGGVPNSNGTSDLDSGPNDVAKNIRVNSFGFTPPGMISYNQDFATGTVRVYGANTLSSGQSLTLDNAQQLYASTATAPRVIRGTGNTLTVTSTSDTAVTQLITVKRQGGAWLVSGTATGSFGPYTMGGAEQDFGQFKMTLTGAAAEGDRIVFGLMAASKDAGVRKSLLFANGDGPGPSLGVPAGASLTLRGTPGGPLAVMDRLAAGSVYAFSSSGTVAFENVAIDDMATAGLRFGASSSLSMSSVTFDNVQAAGGAYLRADGLTADATFYNVTFNDTPNRQPYSVNVQGVDSGLRWYFVDFGGARSGDMKDNDPNQKVLWADAAGPQPPGGPFAASLGTNEGEISLAWTTPADVESDLSTTTLKGGTFRVYRSTNQAARDGAVVSDAQTATGASAPPGTPQTRVESGLLLGATYYFRLWAADEFGNGSPGADAQGLARRFPVSLASNFQATAASNTVTLTWTPTAPPDAAYRGDYRLERSTESGSGYGTVALVPASSTTYTDPDLAYETDYYYRLMARDNGTPPLESGPVQASTRTAEVTDPSVSLISVGASAVGVAWTGRTVALNFNKTMNAASVGGAVGFRRVKDNMGNPLNEDLTGSVAVGGTGSQYAVTLPALAGNSTYELTVATTAGDNFGKFLAGPSALRFTTLMDRSQENVATEGTGGAVVRVPAGAMARDGYVRGSAAPAGASSATQKLVRNTGDGLRSPVPGGTMTLDLLDDLGAPQALSSPVTVSIPYPSDGAGFVAGAGPKVKARTLAVYWLDEPRNVWVRLNSVVDEAAGTVSARAPRLAAFAAIGASDADVAGAIAHPSPWRASAGVPVTFSGVGQGGRVEIYDVSGRLVREIFDDDADSQVDWDVRDADGVTAAAGVYFYRVKAGDAEKTGKLAVIR